MAPNYTHILLRHGAAAPTCGAGATGSQQVDYSCFYYGLIEIKEIFLDAPFLRLSAEPAHASG
jgi:hypothetical protein